MVKWGAGGGGGGRSNADGWSVAAGVCLSRFGAPQLFLSSPFPGEPFRRSTPPLPPSCPAHAVCPSPLHRMCDPVCLFVWLGTSQAPTAPEAPAGHPLRPRQTRRCGAKTPDRPPCLCLAFPSSVGSLIVVLWSRHRAAPQGGLLAMFSWRHLGLPPPPPPAPPLVWLRERQGKTIMSSEQLIVIELSQSAMRSGSCWSLQNPGIMAPRPPLSGQQQVSATLNCGIWRFLFLVALEHQVVSLVWGWVMVPPPPPPQNNCLMSLHSTNHTTI